MAGNDQACMDLFSKLRGFLSTEVACHAAPRVVPIDGEQGTINLPMIEPFDQTIVRHTVAAVIDGPTANLNNQTKETVVALFVLLERFVGRGDGMNRKNVEAGTFRRASKIIDRE
jgi:hypothetical protein